VSIEEMIDARGIIELLHFTTHRGLTGILDQRLLKARARLSADKRLEYILQLNTSRVLDPGWEDYVNLSISRINTRLYGISRLKWHPDAEWRILAFSPGCMTHAGVHFVTTNNAYPSRRCSSGSAGLEALFAANVPGLYGAISERSEDMPLNHTTDPQAEVLYPGELSTDHLLRIYVQSEIEQDDVHGLMFAVQHPKVEIVVDRGKFS
jgi:ssDNA thymidine ADP-ribosyltransferase, DarT